MAILLKVCTTCHVPQAITAFNRMSSAKDGLQARCRACSRQWYLDHSVAHRENARRNRQRARAMLRAHMREFLSDHPCADCGETDLRCLEFDHLDPAEKSFNVTDMVKYTRPWAAILEEIAKCVVRCANCHRRRTSDLCPSWRSEP